MLLIKSATSSSVIFSPSIRRPTFNSLKDIFPSWFLSNPLKIAQYSLLRSSFRLKSKMFTNSLNSNFPFLL